MENPSRRKTPPAAGDLFILKDAAQALLAQADRYPQLEGTELHQMIREARDGDPKARAYIVGSHLRLVAWIARRYHFASYEFSDLLQEGSMGILEAIERFDPDKGTFATYARWWIQQKLSSAMRNRSSFIRLPKSLTDARKRVKHAGVRLHAELGRSPTAEEISARLPGTSLQLIRECIGVPDQSVWSLDEKPEHALAHYDLLKDDSQLRPDQAYMAKVFVAEITDGLLELEAALEASVRIRERAKDVFRVFYDLDGSLKRKTLEETSQVFGITRERVRQVVQKCWKVLGARGIALTSERMHDILATIDDLQDLTHTQVR